MTKKPYVEVYQRKGTDVDLYDWRLVAANGEIVCSSLQGYTRADDAVRGYLAAQELFNFINLEVRFV